MKLQEAGLLGPHPNRAEHFFSIIYCIEGPEGGSDRQAEQEKPEHIRRKVKWEGMGSTRGQKQELVACPFNPETAAEVTTRLGYF